MRHAQFTLVASFLLVACHVVKVATGPGTDYPCGVDGVVCTDANGAPNHMCCDQNETCGGSMGSVGCPPGECCYIGPSDAFGAKKPGNATDCADGGKATVSCGDGKCCNHLEVCGGQAGVDCPAGTCCYVGHHHQGPEHS